MNYGLSGTTLAPETPKETSKMVRYRVRITGHAAPYQWAVERFMPNLSNPTTPTHCQGESETYEGAQFDAAEAARASEWNRLHSATERYEELFEVPAEHELPDFQG